MPIGEASIVREGSDITLVAWGQQVPVLEQAVSWECEETHAVLLLAATKSGRPMLCRFWQHHIQGGPWPVGGGAEALAVSWELRLSLH